MPLDTITFDEIPSDWRVPGTSIEIKPRYTNAGVLGYPAKALMIGQKLAAGTGAAATPYRITRREQATALFGLGSIAEQMAHAFLDANATSELWVMALADAGGAVAATATQAITGTATASGTFALAIGPWRIPVTVAAGAAAAAVATALRNAVNAATYLPVTAGGSAGNVLLTARHAGAVGNDIRILLNPAIEDATPAGLTITVAQLTGGSGAPDIGTALAAIAPSWYTDIATAWGDSTNLGLLDADLATRYTAMGKRDAMAYVGWNNTFGGLSSAGGARNGKLLFPIGANAAGSMPWQWAAQLAAVACFNLSNDPARQLRTLALPTIVPPLPASRFTMTEQDLLLRDGVSTWDVDSGGIVRLQRVISTYQTSPLGVADTAWLDIMTPRTLSRIRYDWASYLDLNYPRHKLADDGAPAAEYDDAVTTCRILHGSWAGRCALYERLGWIEDARRTVGMSTFVRDGTDRNRVNANLVVRILGNLMRFAARLEFEV